MLTLRQFLSDLVTNLKAGWRKAHPEHKPPFGVRSCGTAHARSAQGDHFGPRFSHSHVFGFSHIPSLFAQLRPGELCNLCLMPVLHRARSAGTAQLPATQELETFSCFSLLFFSSDFIDFPCLSPCCYYQTISNPKGHRQTWLVDFFACGLCFFLFSF